MKLAPGAPAVMTERSRVSKATGLTAPQAPDPRAPLRSPRICGQIAPRGAWNEPRERRRTATTEATESRHRRGRVPRVTQYIIRRLIQLGFVLVGVSVVVFFTLH